MPEVERAEPELDESPTSHPSKRSKFAHIQLLRVVERTVHVSPLDRLRQIDFTIFNSTKSEVGLLYLPLAKFARNLQVLDEGGQRLNYLPNSYVKESLADLQEKDLEAHALFVARFKHVKYPLCVVLPKERTIQPGALRTVRIEFESEFPAAFFPIWNAVAPKATARLYGTFFHIPKFSSGVSRYGGHDYDHFLTIVAPTGYSVKGTRKQTGATPSNTIYVNGLEDSSRVIQVRLPPADQGPYSFEMNYSLVPARPVFIRSLIAFWGLSAALFMVLAAWIIFIGAALATVKLLAGAAVTATGLFIVSFHDSWLDRYKILLGLLTIAHLVIWLTADVLQ